MSLYKRQGSEYFWVSFTHNGQRIQQTSGTSNRKQAQEFHDKLKASLWEQNRLGLKPSRSWKEAVVRWLDHTADKATHKEDIAKLKWLDRHLGHLQLHEVTSDVIHSIKSAKLKEKVAKATVNRYLALVRSILRAARDDWDWVDKIPTITLYEEKGNRVRHLSRKEAVMLLRYLPLHQRPVVRFALATGLRQANVVELDWARVDLDRKHAWIEAEDVKNGDALGVPLNEAALRVLRKQLGKHPTRVFTYRGQPFRNANTKAWRNALKKAGIFDFRWHDLRHTWATRHRKAGTPTHELQRLGGWKTAAMVNRYAHLSSDDLAGAAGRIDGKW
jgi:integrase